MMAEINVKVSGPKGLINMECTNHCYPGCLTVMYDAEYVGLIQIRDIKKKIMIMPCGSSLPEGRLLAVQ